MLGDEAARELDHVLRLAAIEPDGLDELAHAFFAERDHLLRRVGGGEQRGRRLVDAGIGRLRGENDGDEQRVGIDVFQLGLRRGAGFLEAAEGFCDFGRRPRLRLAGFSGGFLCRPGGRLARHEAGIMTA